MIQLGAKVVTVCNYILY